MKIIGSLEKQYYTGEEPFEIGKRKWTLYMVCILIFMYSCNNKDEMKAENNFFITKSVM